MTEITAPVRVEMQEISAEITRLSAMWYEFVGFDHHKDRDCHWMIDVAWSYGGDPVFIPNHYGYIAERWTGPKCTTMVSAMRSLLRQLQKEIRNSHEWAVRDQGDPESWSDERQIKYALDNFGGI